MYSSTVITTVLLLTNAVKRWFTKETKMTSGYMSTASISLVVKEMQTKIKSYQFFSFRLADIYFNIKYIILNFGAYKEKSTPSYCWEAYKIAWPFYREMYQYAYRAFKKNLLFNWTNPLSGFQPTKIH